jgi:hypothetical protein
VKGLKDFFLNQFNFLLMKKFRLLLLSLAFLAFATSMVDAHDCEETFTGTWHYCTEEDQQAIMDAVTAQCGAGNYTYHWVLLPIEICNIDRT